MDARRCLRTLHVIESGYIAEIVDPATGLPAASGELVLTNQRRVGPLLLRYRTGDPVERAAESSCACGTYATSRYAAESRGAPTMAIVVRGVNVYPGAVENILRACGGVG